MSDPGNLGEYFADIVCSKHNQNVMIRFVAIAGYGKSWAAMQLAYQISKYIAINKGGTARDYFNFEKDLAVISLEEVQRVMAEGLPYHVLLLDDVSAKAMNARNFQSAASKDLNSIIQTWRPNHNALITTQQAAFLVDKVWREIFNYQIEVVESCFDDGFVLCKVTEIVLDHNNGGVRNPYLTKGKYRYVKHVIPAPPIEWREAYEAERARQLTRIRDKEEDEENTGESKKEKLTKEMFYTPVILKIIEEEGYVSQKAIMKSLVERCGSTCSQPTISNILNKIGVEA